MNPNRTILVGPPGALATECVVGLLEAAGMTTTSEAGPVGAVAVVAVDVPGVPLAQTVAILSGQVARVPLLMVTADTASADHAPTDAVVTWGAHGDTIVRAVVALVDGPEVGATVDPAAADTRDPLTSLTAREHEVVTLIARGHRNDEIARDLGISRHTARTHVQRVLDKLGVPSRHAAAVVAQRSARIPQQVPWHVRHSVRTVEAS